MTKKEKLDIYNSNEITLKFKTILFILSSIGIILFLKAIFYPSASADVISQWYPINKYRIQYFFSNLDLPLWNPYINGGVPELDVSFPFSISHILTLGIMAPLKTTFGISYLITIILGGIFCFQYLKSKKINDAAALIAAIIYMLSGDMISYFYPGHLGKPMVMALIPLTLYITDMGFKLKKTIFFPLAGFLLGISYMRHPQIFYYFLLFFSCYFFFKLYFLFKNEQEQKFNILIKGILWFILSGITAVCIASPTLFHQYFYQKLTSRGTLKSQGEMWNFATSWSHHPLELLTFFIPSIFGLYNSTYLGWKPFVQTTDYLGIITLFLAVTGIVIKWKNKYIKFYFITLIIMILFGLGKYFSPFYKLFFNYVPLIKKFRVPPSTYLIATFIIIYFAFHGITSLIAGRNNKEIKDKIKKILIIFMIFLFILSIWIYTDNYKNVLMNNISPQNTLSDNSIKRNVAQIIQKHGWQGEQYIKKNIIGKTYKLAISDMWKMWLWVVIFLIIYFSFTSNKIKKKTFLILLTLLIFLDLYIIDRKFINTTDNYDIIDKETSIIKFLKNDNEKFRILPLLNTNEANKWGLFKLESVTGYHAAGLKIYEDIMKAGLLNNLNFLGLFNGKYIISQRPFNINDLELIFQSPKGRFIYKNKRFLPRFFLVDKYVVIKDETQIITTLKQNKINYKNTVILEEEPHLKQGSFLSVKNNIVKMIQWDTDVIKFKCKITNPCFLFLSEIYFPKWRTYVMDKRIKTYKANYLFRSILLEKGEYMLICKFHNNGSYLITALLHYILSIICIILIIKLTYKNHTTI